LRGHAICIANKETSDAEALFRVHPATKAERKAFEHILLLNCLIPGESVPYDFHLRGIIAEALVDRLNRGKGRPGAVYALPTIEELASMDATEKGYVALTVFGECVATKNPAGVAALLAVEPASKAEKQAARDLAPTFGLCAEKGVQFSLTPILLRCTLAEGSYRVLATRAAEAKAVK
jgi:hypothetical protein